MAAIAELNDVLTRCGVNVAAQRTRIINNEGFTTVADFGMLEGDADVAEMAKRLASRPAANRVNLGTIVLKRIQALVYWVRDRQKRGLGIDAADFTDAAMLEAMRVKVVRKELKDTKEPDVKDLGKFDPDLFESYEDAFANLLAQSIGVQGEPLRYVIRDDTPPAVFATTEQERMYQLAHTGDGFDLDNAMVYRKLKAFLIDGPGWPWIEPHDADEDGREAWLAWTNHYNGEGELSKRTALAKAKLDVLHYKNERSMSFEKVVEQLSLIFQTLNKDDDESLSDRQQVEKLLKCITTDDPELRGAKVVVSNQYAADFTNACAFFSREVARIHGPAQLEARRDRSCKRRVSSTDRTRHGRGRFGGRGGGRGGRGGRFGGRSGRGGRGNNNRQSIINGVDVSDPTRSFTDDEWNALSFNGGRAYVAQARERMSASRGGQGGGQRSGDGGRGPGQRNAGAVHIQDDDTHQASEHSTNTGGRGERGGRNGTGFGRGAYGGNRSTPSSLSSS